MPTKHLLSGSGVSRRDMIRIGAGGLGFGLFGGIGPVPVVFSQASLRRPRAAVGQDPRRLRVVRRQRRTEHHRAVRRPDVLQAPARRSASKRTDVLKIDAQFGWHKSMRGMKHLYDEGKVAIVQGVGYDQPSFSHFTSMSFWHTAAPNSGNEYGWVGRTASALDPAGARENMIVNISDSQTLAVKAREARAARVHRSRRSSSADVFAQEKAVLDTLGAPHDAGRRRAQVRAGSDEERGAGIGGRARRVEPIPGQGQPGSAPARSRQGRGAHRSGFPDEALLRAAAQQPVRHARQPGRAARSAAPILL